MATNPIYVETEEEIPEVVERLRRFHGDDTLLVLPSRSRIGQSRFNLQLLRNYAARLGKQVTVVCDDPAVQKMATESGFKVFGAVDEQGEGLPSEDAAPVPPRRWWQRSTPPEQARVSVAAPTKLLTKSATELKPGRFLLYVTALTMLAVGLFALGVYVPSASVTLVAQAQPYVQNNVEIQAEPGKAPIRVRTDVISRSSTQGFKTTGVNQIQAVQAFGQVAYTNGLSQGISQSPGLVFKQGQRLRNTNGIMFVQTSPDTLVVWHGQATVNVTALSPGVAGNVGANTITEIMNCCSPFDGTKISATNPQATGGGVDASSTPTETLSDFDAARAQLEQELRQGIAQELASAQQSGEKISETIVYGAPTFTTDHQPGDNVPSFSGTMTLQGEGDFYNDPDVHKAYSTYLSQRVPVDQQLLTESPIQVSYRILSASQGGHLTFIGTATAFVAPRLDEAKIRASIVGRPLSSAKFYLQTLPIRSVTIKESPMTLPLMPVLVGRITLHYVVEPGTGEPLPTAPTVPAATPNPSATPSP